MDERHIHARIIYSMDNPKVACFSKSGPSLLSDSSISQKGTHLAGFGELG